MCKNDMHLVWIKLQLKPLSFSILTMKRIGNIIVSYRIRSPRFMIKKTSRISVSALTQASQIGDLYYDVRIGSRSNQEFYIQKPHRTVFNRIITGNEIMMNRITWNMFSILISSYQSSRNIIMTYRLATPRT